MDIHAWTSMWISTLLWIIEDWHPKIMNNHVDIRGIFVNLWMGMLWILGPERLLSQKHVGIHRSDHRRSNRGEGVSRKETEWGKETGRRSGEGRRGGREKRAVRGMRFFWRVSSTHDLRIEITIKEGRSPVVKRLRNTSSGRVKKWQTVENPAK